MVFTAGIAAGSEILHLLGKKIRVTHLLSGKEGGGISTVIRSLINNFDKNLVEASFLLLSQNRIFEDGGKTSFHVIKKSHRGSPFVIQRIVSHCREYEIDILHTHSISGNFYGRIAGIFMNKTAVVTTVHAWTREELRGAFSNPRIMEWLHGTDLWMHRFSDRLIIISHALADDLVSRGVPAEKMHVITHGIRVEDFQVPDQEIRNAREALNIPPGAKIVGIVGRLTPVKNHQLFLRAAKQVLKIHKACRFLIVGDGPLRKNLESLARDLSIEEQTIFAGWVNPMAPVLHLMDILAVTSRSEGFGYVLLEGMACGKAIVATNVSDIPRIISHGKTGLLVPSDDHRALAKSISSLLQHPVYRAELGALARKTVAVKFQLGDEVRRTTEVYWRALNRRTL
jgi:glycosyltransferase involved in cell wall biosynthesis